MTLERNWDRDPWMHTRTNLESFDPNSFAIKGDYDRNKMMKKHNDRVTLAERIGINTVLLCEIFSLGSMRIMWPLPPTLSLCPLGYWTLHHVSCHPS